MALKNSGMIFRFAGIFILSTFLASCEKEKYNLLDPADTGIWTLFNTGSGLPGNTIRDIVTDKQGLLWVAFSGNGIASSDGFSWTSYKTSNSGILSNSVTTLEIDEFGSVLTGTTNGLSIRAENGQWSFYQDPPRILNINTIKVTSTGDTWFGTEGQGFYVDEGTGFQQIYSASFANVNDIEEDHSGNIWIGTDNGLLKWNGSSFTLFTTGSGLPASEVKALCVDSKSRLWVGTTGGSTVTWIDSGNTLHQVTLFNGPYGVWPRKIFEDRRGNIWFATWYDGLIMYNGFFARTYKEYNGFFENDINTIGADKTGNLWFGLYSRGLVKYTLPLQ
jgi:ligand-binding sensor domain-containing protein